MLYFFYGEECPHCHAVMPIVDKLIKEGKNIQKMETWHEKDNAEKMSKYDKGLCGGVPFFYNEESEKWIWGEASEEEIRAWAESK